MKIGFIIFNEASLFFCFWCRTISQIKRDRKTHGESSKIKLIMIIDTQLREEPQRFHFLYIRNKGSFFKKKRFCSD